MTDEHIVTAGSLTAYLQSVRMEIDDDDEDIVEVSIELTNESAIPVGGLTATINTSTGSTIEPTSGVTSIGPGLTRSFSFAFKLSDGNWSFSLNGQGQTLACCWGQAHVFALCAHGSGEAVVLCKMGKRFANAGGHLLLEAPAFALA